MVNHNSVIKSQSKRAQSFRQRKADITSMSHMPVPGVRMSFGGVAEEIVAEF